VDDPLRVEFAKALLKAPPAPRARPVKYRQWGEGLDHDAVMQMATNVFCRCWCHANERRVSRQNTA